MKLYLENIIVGKLCALDLQKIFNKKDCETWQKMANDLKQNLEICDSEGTTMQTFWWYVECNTIKNID